VAYEILFKSHRWPSESQNKLPPKELLEEFSELTSEQEEV